MLKQLSSACLAVACLALPGLAQGNCSTLDVTTQLDPVRPLQTVTVNVQGTLPNAMVVLALSPRPGKSTINLRSFGWTILLQNQPEVYLQAFVVSVAAACVSAFHRPIRRSTSLVLDEPTAMMLACSRRRLPNDSRKREVFLCPV